MESEPIIVVLEDEWSQLVVLRSILSGLGIIHEFTEPQSALDFMKKNRVDVAIIDIHMRESLTDGVDFMRSLREFDSEVCIIVRTGDTSAELADSALEVRAYRRAIKGRITVSEMRDYTVAAIHETRAQRRMSAAARNTDGVRSELANVLGSVEEELSVAECYKSLVISMKNQLTAISAFSEVLASGMERGDRAIVGEYVRKNRALTGRLVEDINAFLEGPFAETWGSKSDNGRAKINGVLEVVQKRFANAPQWNAVRKAVTITGLLEDMFVSVPPMRLITALRHLLEYVLLRSADNTVVRVVTSCVKNPETDIQALRGDRLVFNRRKLCEAISYLELRVSTSLCGTTLGEIREAFHVAADDLRSGNLQMLNLAIGDLDTALVVHQPRPADIIFILYIPVAR